MKEEGELFTEGIRSGQAAALMARIDKNETLEDVQAWHLREFLACGGDPRWFGSHIGTLLGQHLKRLNHSTLEKLRLPLPGGRYYVMPTGVGQRAGLAGLAVAPGERAITQSHPSTTNSIRTRNVARLTAPPPRTSTAQPSGVLRA